MADELNPKIIVSIETDASGASQGINDVRQQLSDLNNIKTDGSVQSLRNALKEAAQVAANVKDTFGESSAEFEQASQKVSALYKEAAGSVGTLRQNLRNATDQATVMKNLFGENSQEFRNAVKEVARLKDEMQEFNTTTQAFNVDNKMQAFVTIAKGATGAIMGVQGAMTLFGVESEEATQTLAKLQGLMAFSQALNSLDDIKSSFKNLGLLIGITKKETEGLTKAQGAQTAATKGGTLATLSFGTALKAIGIFLFISAITLLIDKWDLVRDSLQKLFPWIGNIGERFNQLKQVVFGVGNTILKFVSGPISAILKALTGDFSGALDSIKGMFNATKNYTEGANAELKRQQQTAAEDRKKAQIEQTKNEIAVLKARGRDTYALEKKNILDRLSLAKAGSDEYKSIQQELAVFEAGHQKEREDKATKAADDLRKKRADAAKKSAEELKQQLEKEKEIFENHQKEIEQIIDDTNKEIARSKLNDRDKELFDVEDDLTKQRETINKAYQEQLSSLQFQLKNKAISVADYNKQVLDITSKNETALANEETLAKQKRVEINKKYHEQISEFLDQYNKTEFEKRRQAIIKEFDALIAVADEKEKEALEKQKNKALGVVNLEENTRKVQTNVLETEINNRINDTDTPEERISKLQAVWDAEKVFRQTKLEEELAKAGEDEELKRQLKLQYQQQEQNDLYAHANALKEIYDADAQAKQESERLKYDAVNAGIDLIATLGSKNKTIAEAAFAVQKGLAIAQIVTNTAAEISGYFKAAAMDPRNGVVPGMIHINMAEAAVRAGKAKVRAGISIASILATTIQKFMSGGSASTVGGTSTTASAPTVTTAPTINALQTTSQIQDVRITNPTAMTTKAYVVEKDLKSQEEKADFLRRLGTIN